MKGNIIKNYLNQKWENNNKQHKQKLEDMNNIHNKKLIINLKQLKKENLIKQKLMNINHNKHMYNIEQQNNNIKIE